MARQLDEEATNDLSGSNRAFKILLLLEYFLRSDKTNFVEASNILKNSLDSVSMSTHLTEQTVIKARKVKLIIDCLVRPPQNPIISPI